MLFAARVTGDAILDQKVKGRGQNATRSSDATTLTNSNTRMERKL